MAVTLSQILEILPTSSTLYSGSLNSIIYRIAYFTPDAKPIHGTLYLADLSKWQNTPNEVCDTPVLYLYKDCINDYFQKIYNFISNDYERNVHFSQLYLNVQKNSPLEEVIELCAKVMMNPVWLINQTHRIIVRSQNDPGFSFPSDNLKDYLPFQNQDTIILEPDDFLPCRQILTSIPITSRRKCYLLVLESETDFASDTAMNNYLQMTTSALSEYLISNNIFGNRSPKEQFFLSLLNDEISDPSYIAQQQAAFGIKRHEKYYLLVIKVNESTQAFSVRSELQSLLHQDFFEYNDHYVALIGCQFEDNISAQTWPSLICYLKKNNFFSGLSNAFLELSSMHLAYEQALKSIVLRRKFSNDTYLSRYEDVIVVHLLDIANEKGISVLSFCHPVFLQIEQYDLKHGTDYLKTLAAYICNFNNLQRTAEVLFIHKNTAYHRLNQIRELFKIDFDNPRLFMKLWLSLSIYNYIGKIKTENILGPLI